MNASHSITMAVCMLGLAAGLALPGVALADRGDETQHERERRWDGHGGRHDERRGDPGRGHDDRGRGNGWGHDHPWQHERYWQHERRHPAPPRVVYVYPALPAAAFVQAVPGSSFGFFTWSGGF